MSKCAVHMMKLKMSAMGGIQSHNQREHESRKNKDIDYSKSEQNCDTVLDEDINYHRAVKSRIEDLDLKKAVRKDAVVYCSFIVSSDRSFFENLGEKEHIRRENESSETVALGLREPAPFDMMVDEEYREECIRDGSIHFFEKATEFFQDRYGAENVINGTIHFDESTPHMHLGIVPVTSDGRLSAKDLFTPMELKQLQTDFAKKVGEKFELERGKEGSEAAHLDEVAFKLQKQQEKLQEVSEEVSRLQNRHFTLEKDCKDLEKRAESLSETILGLKADISTLDTQKRFLERLVEQIKQVIAEMTEKAKSHGLSMNELKVKVEHKQVEDKQKKALEFIERAGIKEQFDKYYAGQDKTRKNRSDKEH